jgi:aspartyl-tRNA(Asn)/glutamyl-tRNA(Gln) amidotransferase subunit B
MTEFEAVIGLEVRVQLQTATKAFCACPTSYGAEPNANTCPVCLGHPGALPVLNQTVVEYAVRMGLATNCSIRPESGFARKNYFYPDLPKGYANQCSLKIRSVTKGYLDVEIEPGNLKRVGITRIHIEEDAGKSIHDMGLDTLVDLNRSGVPLIEIVSEPDIRSAHEALVYLTNLRQIVMYLGICDGNLEEGSMRCDANVSIRPKGASEFGTRTEIKNLNSFRNAEKAIEFEISRQTDLVNAGGTIVYETRMWDAGSQQTRAMRSKEAAHDYRYFPEPDLGTVFVDHEWASRIASRTSRTARFIKSIGSLHIMVSRTTMPACSLPTPESLIFLRLVALLFSRQHP